ncbi:hypothetical protein OIN60_10470 [Paenibacillus sp. P96]|uniref:IucA/IucC family siderophore biosynthesis protein n=1 Tax=Paenibacillus zeirhizosphaerae TaxID=2987519 RepID=A0ABT9FR97_9BACL|nr:IucA/IucC family protein [Paenibacillus sp. P96]MDP4097194.1 hypothetical protein [Paenibacillus sp. P96]
MLETVDNLRSEIKANLHQCKVLLNSYIREFCSEHPESVAIDPKEYTYTIRFGASGVHIYGRFSYFSVTGEHEYESFYVNGGEALDHAYLVQLIIQELRQQDPSIPDERTIDFINKVENSYEKLVLFLQHSDSGQVQDYISSEQSLLYGHPFHPFPKNTMGFSAQEVRAYCPELRSSFQLCYFAVREDVFEEEWVTEHRRIDLDVTIAGHTRRLLMEKGHSYAILPLHPWQYEHVQTIQAVQEYIEQDKLIPLGSLGPRVYPTSSVRTVYIPDLKCNIKLSLNIQITNLMRNNNREQMRRTMDAAGYLLRKGCFAQEPHTQIAYEIGVCTCRFGDDEITKLFTSAYRSIDFDESSTYVLSSLVEVPLTGERPRLFSLMNNRSIDEWFRRYLQISLLPIIRVAEVEGIHFEAHLQNSLLTIRDGLPHVFIIRDLEGVSVNRERAGANENTAGPLFYSKEDAWARTAYYFFVNHLGSLIHAIASGVDGTEEQFWRMVWEVLVEEYARNKGELIQHLLTADAFLAKKNLMSCLTGNSESPAYIPVTNVMKYMGSETSEDGKQFV